MRQRCLIGICLLAACHLATIDPARGDEAKSRLDFFENKIRPALVKHCYACHSGQSDSIGGGLRLDHREGMLSGGQSGPAIVKGQPDDSLLMQAIRYDGLDMPPDAPLPETVVNDFAKWIEMGAEDPRSEIPATENNQQNERELLWSFFPRQRVVPPSVRDLSWPRDPIDYFVLSRIERENLEPTIDADPATLIRRLHHDLIGLPPTRHEIESFVQSYNEAQTPEAKRLIVERLVDALLASDQYAVRWGRHWLDVARFGESNGNDGLGRNATFPNAWRYRDYVIESFNRDVPYDRFITEQIAGDLLPYETAQQRNRQLTATGFLAIGSKPASAMNANFAMDIVDDQINAVCTAVIGISVACARCHDHKHDPIPTSDYYALAGIFASTETLYGAAANEKLTAPPTPLHELYARLPDKTSPADRKAPPRLPESYNAALGGLRPFINHPLDATPDESQIGLKFQPPVNHDVIELASVKETTISGKFSNADESYSVSLWFKNSIENLERPITAYLFSRAPLGDKSLPGDHLGIGGNHDKSRSGKLFVFNGNQNKQSLAGLTVIDRDSWNHIVLIRDAKVVRVVLNGRLEIEGPLTSTFGKSTDFCLANRSDNFAPLQGNLGHVSIFDRALSVDEAIALHDASGHPKGVEPITIDGYAMGVREKVKVANTKIHINGEGSKLGAEVPRGLLTAYQKLNSSGNETATLHNVTIGDQQSGRLELARWLAHPDHPQTARVMANRIWMNLFGQAIVATTDDFGVYGARPSHPELLDHLADRLVKNEWSIKKMIRDIVLSRTYQLHSQAEPEWFKVDPDNRLFARHLRRRMDAETLRDSILHASGAIDYSPGQKSAIANLDVLINTQPHHAASLHRPHHHRSVYLCLMRHAPPSELAAFDLPDGVSVQGQRETTTLPTQSLFLLNSDFVVDQSNLLATRLISDDAASDSERIDKAFANILARGASEHELDASLGYLSGMEQALAQEVTDPQRRRLRTWASLCQALFTTNEFRYID